MTKPYHLIRRYLREAARSNEATDPPEDFQATCGRCGDLAPLSAGRCHCGAKLTLIPGPLADALIRGARSTPAASRLPFGRGRVAAADGARSRGDDQGQRRTAGNGPGPIQGG